MNQSEIPHLRLHNQHLKLADFNSPADAVHWFGAVQAQDYLGSLWAIGQRMKYATENTIEDAITKRTIVRSWPMRGTLHFTHAQDIRWMLRLLAPRIIKRSTFRYKELGLTDETFTKSSAVFTKALIGGKQLRRDELFSLLDANNISPQGQRGIHILSYLSMQGLLCFGSRQGKQFTFTLLDEWLPQTKMLEQDGALAELTKRYFASHGPATVKDFVWWSGLTVTEVKRGIELVKKYLAHEIVDEQIYYFALNTTRKKGTDAAYLLPAYDEYTVAYKDRSAIINSNNYIQAGNGLLSTIVMYGRIIGTWKREIKKYEIIITPHFFTPLNKKERALLNAAAKKYGEFMKKKVVLL